MKTNELSALLEAVIRQASEMMKHPEVGRLHILVSDQLPRSSHGWIRMYLGMIWGDSRITTGTHGGDKNVFYLFNPDHWIDSRRELIPWGEPLA